MTITIFIDTAVFDGVDDPKIIRLLYRWIAPVDSEGLQSGPLWWNSQKSRTVGSVLVQASGPAVDVRSIKGRP